jgi:hypothetical protein
VLTTRKSVLASEGEGGLVSVGGTHPDHDFLKLLGLADWQNDTPLLLESDSEGSEDEVVLDEGFLLKATSLRRREAAQAAAAAVHAAEVAQQTPHTTLQKLAAFKHRFPAKQVTTCLRPCELSTYNHRASVFDGIYSLLGQAESL